MIGYSKEMSPPSHVWVNPAACACKRTDHAWEMAIRSLFPASHSGKPIVGETADDLSGARRLRGVGPCSFRAIRGAGRLSGFQMAPGRLVPYTGRAVGGAH